MNQPDIVSSPDVLKSDPDSMAFFVLRDEQLVVYKLESEAPFWKQRSSYLSAGRFSPKHKKVVFWPDPVNPGKAMELLIKHRHVDKDYTYSVPAFNGFSKRTSVFGHKPKDKTSLDTLDGIRKREVEVLMNNGMRRQKHEDCSEKGSI